MPTYLFLRRLRRSPAAFSGLTLVILLVLTALFAPWLAPHDPNWQDAAARLQGPGAGHWLGTDSYGRDLLSRLLYGARPALGLVALVTAITLPVGLLVGILSGYYGGWLERILMRFTDVVMSMPRLILAFAFVAMLGPGLVNGALALALTTWPAYARQARSEIQRLRHSDYLAAAEMLGHSRRAAAGRPYSAAVSAVGDCPAGARSGGHYPRRRRARLSRSGRPPADGGVGSDDCRRDAGDFRPVVDRRHPRRGDPARQPGV
ncbi:dipeptide transport system permease DppC [Klebsiella pneumoniae subsp. rhinoscleromatis]|nr:dipeptide transport system permease DppC [Klebsiella pneumoniae subsp. rhinoscleromatis]